MANRVGYGYDIRCNGELVINEAEAKAARWIFDRYLAGDRLGMIAAGLKQQGMNSPTCKPKWNREAITRLLSNEKYIGSVLLQKMVSVYGIQLENDGEQDQVWIKGHHEAIIPVSHFK